MVSENPVLIVVDFWFIGTSWLFDILISTRIKSAMNVI